MATTHDSKSHESKSHNDAALPKGETADQIHDVTTALKGDLTKLAGGKADSAIAHWEGVLEKIGGAGAKGIHGDLGKLREHLKKADPDGVAIGKLLHGLSTKTAKVAEDTGGVVGTALKSLAGALEKAGKSLDSGAGDDHADRGHATKKSSH